MMLSKNLDDALCRDFPNVFRDRNASVMESPMGFGFECGDGWEPLIRDAAEALESFISQLPEAQRRLVRCAQVKEKYGTLRFYVDCDAPSSDSGRFEEPISLPKPVLDAIDRAEARSGSICEICGAAGELRRSQGWHSTRCDRHA